MPSVDDPSSVPAPAPTVAATARRGAARVVARNTASLLAAQVLMKILGFGFSVFVVRSLGQDDFGRYAATMASVALFGAFTDLGTSALSVREMARRRSICASMVPDLTALRVLLSVSVIIVLTTATAWLGKPAEMVWGMFVGSCVLLLYAFQGPLDSLLIAEERLDFSAAFSLLNQIVFIGLGTVLLLAGAGYLGLLIASLVGVLAMTVACRRAVGRILGQRFERPNLRRAVSLLRASAPFGVMALAGMFSRRFDTVFMALVLTDAAVGWYNVPYNLIAGMLLLAQALGLSIFPALIREYDSGRGSLRTTVQPTLRHLLLVSLPIALGGTLLADRIIMVLYGSRFAPAIPLLQIMLWALPPMFLAEILGRTAAAMHLERVEARLTVGIAALSVVLMLLCIPTLGTIGAALVMVVTWFLIVIVSSFIIGPALLWKDNTGPVLRTLAANALMGVVVWAVRHTAFVQRCNDKPALIVLVGTGAVAYASAVMVFGAVSRSEARYLWAGLQGGMRWLERGR